MIACYHISYTTAPLLVVGCSSRNDTSFLRLSVYHSYNTALTLSSPYFLVPSITPSGTFPFLPQGTTQPPLLTPGANPAYNNVHASNSSSVRPPRSHLPTARSTLDPCTVVWTTTCWTPKVFAPCACSRAANSCASKYAVLAADGVVATQTMRIPGFAWQKWLVVVRKVGSKRQARWNEVSRSPASADRKRTSSR
jgi:hypothetical protein